MIGTSYSGHRRDCSVRSRAIAARPIPFSIDGQSITDQQSKVFSNQVPVDAIQSVEVIQGAPPSTISFL
jgi:hypothetical protein